MSSAAKVGIVQFAGEGYDVWRFRVETQMSAHGVKEMLTKDVPMDEAQLAAFREKDEKAKALLVAYIADSHLEYVRDKDTAKEMWNSLANTFAKKGFATQTYIRRSLATLKMVEGTPLMDHFRRFDELIRQLKGAGATVSELDAVSQLFISLPSSYDVVTTAMENLGDDQLKLDTVKARLLAEEQKRSGRESGSFVDGVSDGSGSAFAAKPVRSKEKNKFQGKCFVCGEVGHKKFSCPKMKNRHGKAQVATVPVDREIALVLSQEERKDHKAESFIEWILDSGASRHMAYNEDYFQDLCEFGEPLVIESAKEGEKLTATKEGMVKGKVAVNGSGLTLSLGNVLFVKNLKFNLLSLSRLKTGVKIDFKQYCPMTEKPSLW